jgi:hypothetical protein
MVEVGHYCYWFQQVDDEGEGRCEWHVSWISRGEEEWKALHHESWDPKWWHCYNNFLIHGSKFFKVYQNLDTTSAFAVFFYHEKTHLWMIMMESRIVMV